MKYLISSISIENLRFQMKKPLFQIINFEILDYLHIEFEMLDIFSEIPSISKKVWNSRY